jgi:hypothetical protein
MHRRHFLFTLAAAAACHPLKTLAEEVAPPASESPLRWGFLGDDESLKETIDECGQVLLVCVYETSLEAVKPPFADVVLRATVIQTVKGTHQIGDRIAIRFGADSLPKDDAERAKFIEEAAAKNLGALKMAFLHGAKSDKYDCDWLDTPKFEPEMLEFTAKHLAAAKKETQ